MAIANVVVSDELGGGGVLFCCLLCGRSAGGDPYRRLQRLIILNDYESIPAELARTIESLLAPTSATPAGSTSGVGGGSGLSMNGNYFVFAVHLYLYVHALLYRDRPVPNASGPFACDANGTVILSAYIRYLRLTEQPQLVAVYARFLPSDEQIQQYADFLRSLPDVETRKFYLERAKLFFPHNIPAITKLLVATIVSSAPGSVSGGGSNSGTPAALAAVVAASTTRPGPVHVSLIDKEKIAALSCFDFELEHQAQEALLQANVLFRSFVCKLSAANDCSVPL